MVFRVAKIFPRHTNSQGDAENADALVSHLTWLGLPAEILIVNEGDRDLPHADLVVIGHVVESTMDQVSRALTAIEPWLRGLRESGAGFLAVGSAMGLLADRGFLAGTMSSSAVRATGELVVAGNSDRELWGFENSALSYERAPGEESLGAVIMGCGNGDGSEGVVSRGTTRVPQSGVVVGTHLHGPVLVRNPLLSKFLLEESLPESAEVTRRWQRQPEPLATAIHLADELWYEKRRKLELR